MSEQNARPLVSVVIPFYQRSSGLLKKCVESILAQDNYQHFHIIVVDDASPVSAEDELQGLLDKTDKLTIVKQANAGPGAARNNGLEHVPPGTKYIAFIDSDDWWHDNFLDTAVSALEAGNDVFFSNSKRFGIDETRFDWRKDQGFNLDGEHHTLIDADRQIYTYTGDFFSYALERSNIISTSAMAYRVSAAPDLRFSTKLFNGQDRLFKLALSQKTNAVAFSTKVLVEEEEGVNIYDSARWGTAKSLVLLSNYIKLCKAIIEELNLEGEHKALISQKLTESRRSYLVSLLHLMVKRVSLDWSRVWDTFKHDPKLVVEIIPTVTRKLLGKAGSQ